MSHSTNGRLAPFLFGAFLLLSALHASIAASNPVDKLPSSQDSRLRDVVYDPHSVMNVPVKRGVVTLVELDSDEAISEVASGLGGDCAKPDAAWCVAAQSGGRTLFVKPKRAASDPNNLTVVTDRRTHVLRFVVLPDDDARQPIYRLKIRAPHLEARVAPIPSRPPTDAALPPLPRLPSPQEIVAERLRAKPLIRNTQYSLAEGAASTDIVPTLVFDDGRFTYLRLPGNGAVPAVFRVLGDGTEALVNTRMEDDLLVVDCVSRRLVLRAGTAVVALWNDAFDLEGDPLAAGTTVPGVARLLTSDMPQSDHAISIREPHHE